MKQHIKGIVDFFISHRSCSDGKFDVQSDSIFLSVLLSILKLKVGGRALTARFDVKSFDRDFSFEQQIIRRRFPSLMSTFLQVKRRIPFEIFETLFNQMQDAFEEADENSDEVVSWSYQFLKRGLEKAAFAKLGTDGAKIEGKDLLFTTQFFTDKYMVRYLVRKTLSQISRDSLSDVVVIDAASGGGNFLIFVFDLLFDAYKAANPGWSKQRIVDTILSRAIVGYDLDSNLARISKLSMFVKASQYAVPKATTPICIYEGTDGDTLGFLNKTKILSSEIGGLSFSERLESLSNRNAIKLFLMNPPFMGKRDMDLNLKAYLYENYPIAKGDLCASFMNRLIDIMQPQDWIGVVAQNNWMYLSSFKDFREHFIKTRLLVDCVDLGSNAFEDINGEKTNVGLFVIKGTGKECSTFKLLRYGSIARNKQLLEKDAIPKTLTFKVDQSKFLKNSKFEFHYQLEDRFSSLESLKQYSEFGKPMQGTSTGDNKKFVKFAWEVNGSPDWKLVSKGGGFSKWAGLNYYKVLWGKNGELVAANQGSAIRNLDRIPKTHLVFSDTGTLGLNVRVLKDGQVFIASGPGIQVLKGDKFAHLAFLNSRISTFLLKQLNPKFTISAGYIGMIPVPEKILISNKIAKWSKECLALKESYLKRKLPNFEFEHIDYSAITDIYNWIDLQIIGDLSSDYARLHLEYKIEKEIRRYYQFSKAELDEVKSIVGESPFYNKKRNTSLSSDLIDTLISGNLDLNCFSTSRAINGYSVGSESVFEDISYKLAVNPDSVMSAIKRNVSTLTKTRNKYLNDLLHKIILHELGIRKISVYKFEIHDVNKLVKRVAAKYHFLSAIPDLPKRLVFVLNVHHKLSFFNKPLVTVSNRSLTVGEVHA